MSESTAELLRRLRREQGRELHEHRHLSLVPDTGSEMLPYWMYRPGDRSQIVRLVRDDEDVDG